MKCSEFLFIFVILTVLVRYAGKYWVENKSYIFSEERIATIAKKYTGKSAETEKLFKPEDAMKKVVKDLRKEYPGHILPDKDLQWIFVNAGGWMGSFCLLHASFTEYVMLFGTAIETAGHSGRYLANITDTILSGTFVQWKEGDLTATTYTLGETIRHDWGEAAAVHWTGGTWMLEYARGLIPTTLPFALTETFFKTHDFLSAYHMIRVYVKSLMQELWLSLGIN